MIAIKSELNICLSYISGLVCFIIFDRILTANMFVSHVVNFTRNLNLKKERKVYQNCNIIYVVVCPLEDEEKDKEY